MSIYDIENFYKSFPTLSHKRNRFPWQKEINYDMRMGEIKPICAIPVVPGMTYHLNMMNIFKVAPLSVPPMDSAICKVFAFYQANRNTWDNYPYWFGEKKYPENPEKEPTFLVPKVILPETGCKENGFFDNIGVPTHVPNLKIDAFLSRMDRQIYNNYFRNQTLEDAIEVNTGDEDDVYTEEIDTLRKICRMRDYFAQALPNQSGGEPVEIPLGSSAPIVYTNSNVSEVNNTPVRVENSAHPNISGVFGSFLKDGTDNPWATNTRMNMAADLSKAMGAPLEGLYQAIAVNSLQYLTSRGGNRYFEQISNVYGVVNPDQVLRLPEFLGGMTQKIQFDTITQTSQTAGQPTGLGNRAANGYSKQYDNIISKSFGEFGWIIIYGVVTKFPKYQQGLSKLMQTEDKLDLFCPLFNYMGDKAIYMSEIYAQDPAIMSEDGVTPINDTVWGYGKRNSEYLYPINEIHGEQRSNYSGGSLDANHFGDFYDKQPGLNKEWDKVDDKSFKRSLSIQDETQFVCNCIISGIVDVEIPLDPMPSPIPMQILEQNRN